MNVVFEMVNVHQPLLIQGYLLATDSKHRSTTNWTSAFRGFLTIFHGYFLYVFCISFCSAFYTIHLHEFDSPPFKENLGSRYDFSKERIKVIARLLQEMKRS